jgi:PadR family transcriptional regulator, regulatory protein PadR
MSEPASLGQFEQLVLTAILMLSGNAYGVTIHARVEDLAKPKRVSLGAVYATLDRLEDKALIASWLSDPTPERGGRSKRHYRLESSGQRALRDAARTARRICDVIEKSEGTGVWSRRARKWKPAPQ